ncbi:MAG: ThuA domain-containing protein [Phycisphaeraceae bacterium]
MSRFIALIASLACCAIFFSAHAQEKPSTPLADEAESKESIKALLVTGEGHHDYETQKKILTEGTSKLADIKWDIWHHKNADEAKDDLSKDGWAKPYDVIVYNICHAHEKDKDFIDKLVKVHKEGKPLVAIHCTMHSYHWNVDGGKNSKVDKEWNMLMGVVSLGHGPHRPITVSKVKGAEHPAIDNMPNQWKTKQGELYGIKKVYPTAVVLAHGDNGNAKHPVIWVNQYGKAKVFGTTLGHHNSTMENEHYIRLITDGIIWVSRDK